MYRLLVVCSLALAAHAQLDRDPGTAAILAETRQLNADGSSNVAYAQEDGVLFKETVNADGERRGSYEYIGDDNKTYRVEYVAGAGGFRILSSTHVAATPVQPVSRRQPTARPTQRPTQRPVQPARQTGTNTFSINYDLSRNTVPSALPTTRRTTTTTTPRPTARRNYHTGQVSLERNEKGYVYTYTHSG